MSKTTFKPVAAAVGFALVGTLTAANLATAAENPFGASPLGGGYLQLAEADKAKSEGKCGGATMSTEAKKAGPKGQDRLIKYLGIYRILDAQAEAVKLLRGS